jgi:2-dehydro-3-deoxy-D-arabinonate dehydratase
MKLYRTTEGVFVEKQGGFYSLDGIGWDELIGSEDLLERLRQATSKQQAASFDAATILPPIVSQEVWAAGVTYYRSRSARIEESKDAGGGDFYDRVYSAERPELFFKAAGGRVMGPGQPVRIRSDARWSVPEPELTLLINPRGTIVGYTVGNDMSSRDIEGENPLYLPQAKVYDGSCALGPCVLISAEPPAKTTFIELEILRGGQRAFSGLTTLAELKRELPELVQYLFRDSVYPSGVFLMTGTGVVPPDEFTLHSGDLIRITIEGIGTLENHVA